MIRFENGEFAGGDFKKVFNPEAVDDISFNMYDNELSKSCWVLKIEDYGDQLEVFNIAEKGIKSIPRHYEDNTEAHGYFWESEETILFPNLEEIREFMEGYCDGSGEQAKLLEELRDRYMLTEAISKFKCLGGVSESSDAELFSEITDLIISKGMDREKIYATLKEILLHQYFTEQEEIEKIRKVY